MDALGQHRKKVAQSEGGDVDEETTGGSAAVASLDVGRLGCGEVVLPTSIAY